MVTVISAMAPTRFDLAGGTLDVWPIPEILRSLDPGRFFSLGTPADSHGTPTGIRTLNAALSLFTSCTLRATQRGTQRNTSPLALQVKIPDTSRTPAAHSSASSESVASETLRTFELSDRKSVEALCHHHPLVAKVVLHFAPHLCQNFESLEVTTDSQVPKGSGLGGSSSLFVALVGAFQELVHGTSALASSPLGTHKDPRTLCETACRLEAGLLQGLAGIQDHLGAAYGGVASYELHAHGIERTALPPAVAPWLETHAVLGLSMDEHHSGNTNWQILKSFLSGDQETKRAFFDLTQNADEAFAALTSLDFGRVTEHLSRDWSIRRKAFPFLSTPQLDRILTVALEAGATGAKVCGAAAGGVMLILHDGTKGRGEAISGAIRSCGAQILPLKISAEGLRCERPVL